MAAALDTNAIIAAFELPDINGVYTEKFRAYFRALSAGRPLLLLAFAPKAAGTFFRQVAIDAIDGYLFRGAQAQGGRDGVPYLPNFIAAFLDKDKPRAVAHLHMQALPVNRNFIEMLDLRPVIMIRNIPDMLASYWDMLESDAVARNDGLNCIVPHDFLALSRAEKADFMVDIIAPWYASYFASWHAYVREAPDRVCVLDYREFSEDPAASIHRGILHAGFSVTRERCDDVLATVWARRQTLRFNKGTSGRGREYFSSAQIGRIGRMLSLYGDLAWRAELLGSVEPVARSA